jgi:hypothetical protein
MAETHGYDGRSHGGRYEMRIGLLTGQEDTFCDALAERIGDIGGPGTEARSVSLGALAQGGDPEWDCVLDRASHDVAFYRGVMRTFALRGIPVVNDPFVLDKLDRFTALQRVREDGIPVPLTLLLPQKEYPPNVPPGALKHLAYPQPWAEYLEGIGGAGRVAPVSARSFLSETPVSSEQDLMTAFDRTGCELVMLQENVPWEVFVRSIVIGGERVIICRYDPTFRQYLNDPGCLTPETEARIVSVASRVSKSLGLDVNAVDFGVDCGNARLADAFNPLPDVELASLSPFYFEKVVQEIAELCVRRARERRPSADRPATRPGVDEVRLKAHVPAPASRMPEGQAASGPRIKVKTGATRVPVQKIVPRKSVILKPTGGRAVVRKPVPRRKRGTASEG